MRRVLVACLVVTGIATSCGSGDDAGPADKPELAKAACDEVRAADKDKGAGAIDTAHRIKVQAVSMAEAAGDPELGEWFKEIWRPPGCRSEGPALQGPGRTHGGPLHQLRLDQLVTPTPSRECTARQSTGGQRS